MKWFFRGLTSLIIIGFIALVIIFFSLNHIIAYTLSKDFSTKVSINSVSLRLKQFSLSALTIHNPTGYSNEKALSVKETTLVAPLVNYFHRVKVFDAITIHDPHFLLEFDPQNPSENNWDELMNNLETHSSSSDPDSYAVIKDLTIYNLSIEVRNGKNIQKQIIPEIHLKNVKTKNGELTQRLTQIILTNMIFNLKNIINFPLKKAQQELNSLFDSLHILK